MRRIKEAYLYQKVHFLLNPKLEHEQAKIKVEKEFVDYKKSMDNKKVDYHIFSEERLPDDSIQITIRRQNGQAPVGEHLKH